MVDCNRMKIYIFLNSVTYNQMSCKLIQSFLVYTIYNLSLCYFQEKQMQVSAIYFCFSIFIILQNRFVRYNTANQLIFAFLSSLAFLRRFIFTLQNWTMQEQCKMYLY